MNSMSFVIELDSLCNDKNCANQHFVWRQFVVAPNGILEMIEDFFVFGKN